MASTAPIGSVRDAVPNRSILCGGVIAGSTSTQAIPAGAQATFYPTQGGIHTVAANAAGVTYTITDAAAPLPYDLRIGEGFIFYVQNNDAADTITFAVGGNVAAGAGTLTVAGASTRIFALTRTSNLVHQLTTLGTLTQ